MMKAKTIVWLVTLLTLLIPQLSLAAHLGYATIVSDTSSSVILRELPSSEDRYDSGSYYVGTEVEILEAGQENGWVAVGIGSDLGYLPAANLSFEVNPVTPKWETAVVNIAESDAYGIRAEPADGAVIIGSVHRGDVVSVMGENSRHWCYVKYHTLYGYIPADKLLMGTTSLPDEPDAPKETNPPQQTQTPAMTTPPPAQGDYGSAFVTAQTSKRVHLRASASAKSRSLGLYYVGTQVQCLSDPTMEWVHVRIGSQNGYMKSEYLEQGTAPLVSRQPSAVVSNGSKAVHLRQAPSSGSALEAKLKKGDVVTVLGETDTSWSYIYTGTAYGYVMSKTLMVNEANTPSTTARPSLTPTAPNNTQSANYTIKSYKPSPQISIQYPVFADEKLNTVILEKLRRMTEDITQTAAMQYFCAVTLHNPKMVSIVFWGESETVGGMHAYTDLQTLNIDVQTYIELTLQDMFCVNKDFEKVFLQKAYYPSAPQTSYDAANFPDMLMLQTPAYQAVSSFAIGVVQCFLKPDGIVLSMPSVHATGCDHFEGQLNYSDVQDFYRLQEKYW